MKQFTPEQVTIESASSLNLLNQDRHREGDHYAAYVGLDVHKKTIAVAIAYRGRGKPVSRAEIVNTPKAVRKLVALLNQEFGGEILLYSDEAGPCGYDLYHQLTALGQECEIVAPSLIPRKPGDRVKTDKRDARGLARYSRSGELTPVWVPAKEQEAMRDLTRAREDIKNVEKMTKQQLGAFLLRHGKVYDSTKVRWTKTHFNWLETVKFDNPVQQTVMQEYIATVKALEAREASLKHEMLKALENWSLRPVVEGLIALRGIDIVSAMTLMAELGDISRFNSPKELMAFLGLVPSEHTSSDKRRLGSMTKTGNGHARRILVESAWSYRFPARLTAHLRRKESKATDPVKAIAWSAQKRLCGRYHKLIEGGKVKNMACVAIARELVGFVWAIVCEMMSKPHNSKCTG